MTAIAPEKRIAGTVKSRVMYTKNSCTRRVQLPDGTIKEKTNSSIDIIFDENILALLTYFARLWDSRSETSGRSGAPKEEGEKEEAKEFIEEVYRRDSQSVDAAGDFVFDRIDRMLSQGEFGICDRVLREIEVLRLSTFVLTALLNITSAAKGHRLPSRPGFFSRVRDRMVEVRGADRAARILKGLE
ncbi:MAG TPA: hypothetical protein DDY78_24355 [Planctomycetales bacterium]|nr:hypothetical protein [Planctomycetales bacterium]